MGKIERDNIAQPQETWPEDLAIYRHDDFVTEKAIDFKLNDYRDDGALTAEQCRMLPGRHAMNGAEVEELSRLIGYALNKDAHINFVKVSRAQVLRRLANKSLGRRNPNATLDVAGANALLASLRLEADLSVEGIGQSRAASANSRSDDPKIISLREAQRILQPDNRRKAVDGRRQAVVECCCYVAQDAGWPLTYTTNDILPSEQRGGRLIELIQDVIEMTSHSGRKYRGHTLKDDIERIKRRFDKRGDLSSRK